MNEAQKNEIQEYVKKIYIDVKFFSKTSDVMALKEKIFDILNNFPKFQNNFKFIQYWINHQIEVIFYETMIKEKGSDIFKACKDGNLRFVQYLIEKENIDIEIKGEHEKTPLLCACDNSQLQIVEYLISKGANINAKDGDGEYVIHYASKGGLLSTVQYLIENEKVDINIKNKNNDAPIHIASKYGHLPIVQYLIENENVDIDIKGNFEKTPLLYACENGHLPIVKYLISKGANIDAKNGDDHKKGDNLLHTATENGDITIVKYLVEQINMDVNTKGYNDRTPLHIACQEGYSHIVEYLISNGANINAADSDGWTPLHIATFNNKDTIIRCLISHGANKNATTKDGRTPYDLTDNNLTKGILF